ncbi:MAG: DNA repair protein RecO [Oscillospiraceae bacterium]|jgi:DNA repair protein RecO (recombination protein O)|nr:DNA repair protein RecO [Oscillospiraceae bacterium]
MRTPALVLRETATGEADKRLTVLSETAGILFPYAKGAMKAKSSRLTGTSLFAYSDFEFSDRRGSLYVASALPIEMFFGLRESVERVALASYFGELAAFLCPKEEPAGEHLRLLLNILHFLAAGSRALLQLKAIAELRLLTLAGFMPDVDCLPSGWLDLREGILINHPSGNNTVKVSEGAVLAIRHICTAEPERLFQFQMSDTGLRELANAAERFLLAQAERRFYTLEFFKRL